MRVFDKLQQIEDLLGRVDQELNEFGETILESPEVERMAVKFNQEQMLAGKDANDRNITPDYTERTIEIKKSKGQVYSRVTLKDKGDFQDNMEVRNANKKLEILSNDSKSEALQLKYGESIFGLNDQHLAMLRGYMLPKFKLHLNQYLR